MRTSLQYLFSKREYTLTLSSKSLNFNVLRPEKTALDNIFTGYSLIVSLLLEVSVNIKVLLCLRIGAVGFSSVSVVASQSDMN